MCPIITRCLLLLAIVWFKLVLNYFLYVEDIDHHNFCTLGRCNIRLLSVGCHFSCHDFYTSSNIYGLSTSSAIIPSSIFQNMKFFLPLLLSLWLNQPLWRLHVLIWRDAWISNSYAPAAVLGNLSLSLYVPFFQVFQQFPIPVFTRPLYETYCFETLHINIEFFQGITCHIFQLVVYCIECVLHLTFPCFEIL